MKPPTANEYENLCRYEMQRQLMMNYLLKHLF